MTEPNNMRHLEYPNCDDSIQGFEFETEEVRLTARPVKMPGKMTPINNQTHSLPDVFILLSESETPELDEDKQ